MNTDNAPEMIPLLHYIHQHLFDPLTLDELSRYAGYSPYHFTRRFKRFMGVSPHYYISDLRLQRAKKLLLETNFTVRDIAIEVGQQSLGTFTTRFTERVGVTPAAFRKSAQRAKQPLVTLRQFKGLDARRPAPSPKCRIAGEVHSEESIEGIVLIGLFPRPIPEGIPLYGTIISSGEPYCLSDVAPGTYFLMATSLSWNTGAENILLTQKTLRTRDHAALTVLPDQNALHEPIVLYPPRLEDPPILISLPLLMQIYLNTM